MSNEFSSETSEYKGSPTLSITKEYDDKDGNKKVSRVLTFGVGKAEAILAQIEAIKKFVEENKKEKLTPEQQQLVQSFIKK